MELFIGLAVVLESTERSLWVPSESHPPAHVRISQLADIVDSGIPGPADPLWVFA